MIEIDLSKQDANVILAEDLKVEDRFAYENTLSIVRTISLSDTEVYLKLELVLGLWTSKRPVTRLVKLPRNYPLVISR